MSGCQASVGSGPANYCVWGLYWSPPSLCSPPVTCLQKHLPHVSGCNDITGVFCFVGFGQSWWGLPVWLRALRLCTACLVGPGEDSLEMESVGPRSSLPPKGLLVSSQMVLCGSGTPVLLLVAAMVIWSRLGCLGKSGTWPSTFPFISKLPQVRGD